jgi:hypothetical protein
MVPDMTPNNSANPKLRKKTSHFGSEVNNDDPVERPSEAGKDVNTTQEPTRAFPLQRAT